MISLAAKVLAGALLSTAFAWIGIRLIAPLGWMDHPSGRKHHAKPMPKTGGFALWATCILLSGLGWLRLPFSSLEWLLIHGFALLGFLDDRWNIPARTKALVTLFLALGLAASQATYLSEYRPTLVFIGVSIPTSPLATFPLLAAWYWLIPHAINLIDGADGLAIGTAVVLFLGLTPFWPGMAGAAALGGALLPIFLLNWPKAKHFLGDCGSLFLGALLSVLVMKTLALRYPTHALWLFGYPILDTLLVVGIRLSRGESPVKADRNHLHHHWGRFLSRKAPSWTVSLVLWSQAALLSLRLLNRQPWTFLAWTGLGLLVAQCFLFARKANRTTASPLHPAPPGPPGAGMRHTHPDS